MQELVTLIMHQDISWWGGFNDDLSRMAARAGAHGRALGRLLGGLLMISPDKDPVVRLTDSARDYREKLGTFFLTGILAAVAIPFLVSDKLVWRTLGGLALVFAFLSLSRLYFPNNAYRMRFKLTHPPDLASLGTEVRENYISYSFKGDLRDGYSSIAAANPVLMKALEESALRYKQGKSAQGNPRGFTYIPGDNPDQAQVVEYWSDLIVFLILRWISQESFMLRQARSSAFKTFDKARLPVNLIEGNSVLRAEAACERRVVTPGSGQVARPYVLPKSARLWFTRNPFPTIGLRGHFVTLSVESRLTEVGVEDGRVFASCILEARVRPRFASFLALFRPWELRMMDDFMGELPHYFGLP